jgi:hypothetical protein
MEILRKVWTFVKAVFFAALILVLVGVLALVATWTKGLALLLILFGVTVWYFYDRMV